MRASHLLPACRRYVLVIGLAVAALTFVHTRAAALSSSAQSSSAQLSAAEPGPAVHSAPAVQSASHEVIVEIRVHGNYTTADADVLRLGGVAVGQTLDSPAAIDAIAARLRASRRFESVELRKRYRSLTATNEVVLIILVREFPSADAGDLTPPGPLGRLKDKMMFLPMLSYTDGYGFTYGGRASFVHALGRDGRISVPLTWGGTKRAAVEFDKAFRAGPISRVEGGAAIWRRENPSYRIDDDRRELWVHADRALGWNLRAGGGLGWTDVGFGTLDDRFVRYGVDLTLDTRQDPAFPRNAVFARAAWETLDFRTHDTVRRTTLEGRGYVGLFGQNVLSLRARYDRADAPLPPYEQALLGGAATLRGFRAGSFAGDNRLVSSVELRMPFTSPLRAGKTGASVFFDSGAAYNHGRRLRDVDLRHGIGAGLFFNAAIFQLNADIAYGLKAEAPAVPPPPGTPKDGGRWRFHLMSGFQF